MRSVVVFSRQLIFCLEEALVRCDKLVAHRDKEFIQVRASAIAHGRQLTPML
jgi:hypothetical protein